MLVSSWLTLHQRKKLLFITVQFGCGKAGHLIKDCTVYTSTKWLSDFDEFSERGEAELDTSVPSGSWIRGRLYKFLHVWRSIGASWFILSVIESGYELPFVSIPVKCFFSNHKSAVDNKAFVCGAISSNCCRRVAQERPSSCLQPLGSSS